ncbi:hypothetical protein ACFFMN_17520 [Planobispora siamensis]|uniref:TetR family transcriptional regulator n=1 Tax=Planobispora siamensis TaxID=936338 RepID=A0A8J3WS36_9ACTN|nr:hypothetical protein [Planobispora siamensis]GIH97501.1 hypothetical protein Psi01_81310 [Planobispora siamensis]
MSVTEGIEMARSEAARAVGVGIATLFYRFPAHDGLPDAVLADAVGAALAEARHC